jgi:hypothetical protein
MQTESVLAIAVVVLLAINIVQALYIVRAKRLIRAQQHEIRMLRTTVTLDGRK